MNTVTTMTTITSMGQYRQLIQDAARAAHVNRVITDLRPLVVYINHGRYVADCPNCKAGIAIEPDWPGAGCMDAAAKCFRWFPNVDSPADRHAIEALLKERPNPENRNWYPGETLQRLRDENRVFANQPRDAGTVGNAEREIKMRVARGGKP